MLTFEAVISIFCQKPGQEDGTYFTCSEPLAYAVEDLSMISVPEMQEMLIANALASPKLLAQGYTRKDVAVLAFDVTDKIKEGHPA